MKYVSFMVLAISLCYSCSTTRNVNTNNDCIENMQFKKEFFWNIKNVENLLTKDQNQSFQNSLKFISKYAPVSFEDMLNYSHTYPTESFKKDKE
ncbi:MAG: hypothetical protein ABSA76_15725, partial [Bacteroidales bacterium]